MYNFGEPVDNTQYGVITFRRRQACGGWSRPVGAWCKALLQAQTEQLRKTCSCQSRQWASWRLFRKPEWPLRCSPTGAYGGDNGFFRGFFFWVGELTREGNGLSVLRAGALGEGVVKVAHKQKWGISLLAEHRYVMFLWSVHKRKGWSAPSGQCLHSWQAWTMASNSWLPTS